MVAGLDAVTGGRLHAPALHASALHASPTVAASAIDPQELPAQQTGGNGTTAFVFQQPTLMPWASVFDNVWLPLRLQGVSRSKAARALRQVLATASAWPSLNALTRRAVGRHADARVDRPALVTQPQVLLMDEPFAALDDITRRKLNIDLLEWWQASRAIRSALLFVTHSVTRGGVP